VKAVLEKLKLAERVVCRTLQVNIDYAAVTAFKRLLARYEADVEAETFAGKVEYTLRLPAEYEKAFRAELFNLTRGEAIIETMAQVRGGVDG
jgi:putative IMPACT (imprinted ancient) family translation regulator